MESLIEVEIKLRVWLRGMRQFFHLSAVYRSAGSVTGYSDLTRFWVREVALIAYGRSDGQHSLGCICHMSFGWTCSAMGITSVDEKGFSSANKLLGQLPDSPRRFNGSFSNPYSLLSLELLACSLSGQSPATRTLLDFGPRRPAL